MFWKVGEESDRARMWDEGILRDERKGARTGHSNMCATLKGRSRLQCSQFSGNRFEIRWVWVRRVCPIRRRVIIISWRLNFWLDDGSWDRFYKCQFVRMDLVFPESVPVYFDLVPNK